MTGAFVVLAGGASRRMGGVEKAFAEIGDRELLCRVLDACAGASPAGVLVANPPTAYAAAVLRYGWRPVGPAAGAEAAGAEAVRAGAEAVRAGAAGAGATGVAADLRFRRGGVRLRITGDLRERRGPVAGMEAGFRSVSEEGRGPVFLAACDLPFLEARVVGELLERLGSMSRSGSRPVAVVPRVGGRLQPLAAAYDAAAGDVASRCLDAGRRRMEDVLDGLEVREVAGERLASPSTFLNVNTPGDLARARHRAASWGEESRGE